MTSPRKVAANRKNSERSTGPKTPLGKAHSCFNALLLGVYAKSVLLPTENPKDYKILAEAFCQELRPRGPVQLSLVMQIVACQWVIWRLMGVLDHLGRRGMVRRSVAFARRMELAPDMAEPNFGDLCDVAAEGTQPGSTLSHVKRELRSESLQMRSLLHDLRREQQLHLHIEGQAEEVSLSELPKAFSTVRRTSTRKKKHSHRLESTAAETTQNKGVPNDPAITTTSQPCTDADQNISNGPDVHDDTLHSIEGSTGIDPKTGEASGETAQTRPTFPNEQSPLNDAFLNLSRESHSEDAASVGAAAVRKERPPVGGKRDASLDLQDEGYFDDAVNAKPVVPDEQSLPERDSDTCRAAQVDNQCDVAGMASSNLTGPDPRGLIETKDDFAFEPVAMSMLNATNIEATRRAAPEYQLDPGEDGANLDEQRDLHSRYAKAKRARSKPTGEAVSKPKLRTNVRKSEAVSRGAHLPQETKHSDSSDQQCPTKIVEPPSRNLHTPDHDSRLRGNEQPTERLVPGYSRDPHSGRLRWPGTFRY